MRGKTLARLQLAKRPVRERRSCGRDRRVLEGTLKYRGQFFPVEVYDLSESGAFLSAPVLPDWSDSVTLTVTLADGCSSVMVSGRVRRFAMTSRQNRRCGGIGVQFTRFFTRYGQESLRRHLAA